MSEDQINLMLSALGHPLRRGIVLHLAKSGPQTYTNLLKKFKLQTGTLNYHLEALKGLLNRDENGRYLLNRNGYIAYHILTHAKASLLKPTFPTIKKGMLIPFLRNAVSGFYKLVFHPTKAFNEAQEHVGAYALCGMAISALFFISTPSLSISTLTRFLVGLSGWVLFCFIFTRLAYEKNPSLPRLIVSISVTYLPAIALNILSFSLASFELGAGVSQPFLFIEDPAYAVLMETFAGIFIWRFILLFFAIRESCRLSPGQAFLTVFVSFIIENVIAFAMDYAHAMFTWFS